MTINEIHDWFIKRNYFVINRHNDTLYLFAKNGLRLGSVEPHDKNFIGYYRTGNNNQKEHNVIIDDVTDLKILMNQLVKVFDREYDGEEVIISEIPTYINGKKFYKTQKLYKKKIPKYEKNLRKYK